MAFLDVGKEISGAGFALFSFINRFHLLTCSSKVLKSLLASVIIFFSKSFKYTSPLYWRIELASIFQPKSFCSFFGKAS